MVKLLPSFLALFFVYNAFTQHAVYDNIQQDARYLTIHPLSLTSASQALTPNAPIQLHKDFLPFIISSKPRLISIELPLASGQEKVILEKFQLFSDDMVIRLSSGESLKPDPILCYRGYIDGQPSSFVTLTAGSESFSMVYADNNGNFEINKSTVDQQYYLTAQDKNAEFSCLTEDSGQEILNPSPGQRSSYADCLELYVECDNRSYLANGSSVPNTQTWLTNIFNNVATLYNNYNVPIIISQVFIWNTADVYASATNLTQMRTSFVNRLISNGLSGKVGYLLSTWEIGGGISHGIGGFCNAITAYPGPCALSTGLTASVVSYPTYSYTIQNVAHELGHVMGLRHSHACTWNNNGSQIDDCGNVIAANNNYTPEGNNCFSPSNPILPGTNGSIMSLCNNLAGQGISFTTGFGNAAGNQLFLNFINAPCFTGVSCGTIPPNNDECIDAIPLGLNQTCQPRTFDNDYGTQSADLPMFSCISQTYSTDVWFSATVPASGSLTIETTQVTGGFTDMIMQTYTGNCGSLVQLACDDNSGAGDHAKVVLTGRPAGEKITIRVTPRDVVGVNDYGEYGICAYDASLPCHPDFPSLVDLYNNTGGASWTQKTGWINHATNCNVCTWYGVVCNAEGRVSVLNLGSNNLTGVIPASFSALNKLTRINLYSNNLSGTLPSFLDNLPLLEYVDLGDNDFTGSLPSSFSNLANVRSLYLDHNNLSGTLPSSLVINPLSVLWLNYNNFSGCIPKTYNDFCTRGASLRLDNNPLLPGGGNYTNFCLNGYGGDFDVDSYCAGSQDCNDMDANSYPGAPEICDGSDNDCDGSIDENIPDVVNTWVGTNGNWNNPLNWSTNIVPQPCHNVVINPGSAYTISITNGFTAKASSVNLGANAHLLIQNNGTLQLANKGELINSGNIVCYGNLTITNPLNTNGTALTNAGQIVINSSGLLNVMNCGSTAIRNTVSGEINNNGIVNILNNHAVNGQYGIDNLGLFSNSGQITIENILGKEIRLAAGAMLENSDAGTIDLK